MIEVAIIEDDLVTRESLMSYIDVYPGVDLVFASISAEDGIEQLQSLAIKPRVMLLDIGLPGASGLESIPKIKAEAPDMDLIMFTTFEEEEKIYAALCAGACSYISKRTPLSVIMDSIITVSEGGSYMSPSIARKIANHFKPKKPDFQLTSRQTQIIEGLVEGLSYKMIANKYNISIDTVRSHIKKIYKLMEVNSSLEVVRKFNEGKI